MCNVKTNKNETKTNKNETKTNKNETKNISYIVVVYCNNVTNKSFFLRICLLILVGW
jgi:hypothetical protein